MYYNYNYKDFESIKTITKFIQCNGINEVVDGDNWTHFHYICNFNSTNLEVIKYCIENGADFKF